MSSATAPSPPTGRRGAYRKTAQRRSQIIDAAAHVFAHVGFRNSTLSEIAKRVGLTAPGVTHHFPTKEALLEAVFEDRDHDANTHLRDRQGIDVLRGILEIAERDEKDLERTRLYTIMAAEATTAGHPAHEYFRGRYDLVLHHVEAAFAHAAAHGQLRDDTDPATAAQSYVAASDGIQLQALFRAGATSQSAFIRQTLERHLTVRL
ncbi:TetR/AcrR family transcriptional regulator [Microbacterium invictum]|uniref:AcrR family transcriptional regulator n=1 Tax=Microbacterium invictum TaxID=515415 RepID=A0AA40SRJ9_9MICO|nr:MULTISPECIES: TetR/AcrR family transcriptional regulator [Microbacterium]MBB4141026.1 AcrR family transcriptional regulator [Microbacterium invictum]